MMMFSQAPRDLFMVIAESSLRNYALAGLFARLQKAIPVYRREDYARKVRPLSFLFTFFFLLLTKKKKKRARARSRRSQSTTIWR